MAWQNSCLSPPPPRPPVETEAEIYIFGSVSVLGGILVLENALQQSEQLVRGRTGPGQHGNRIMRAASELFKIEKESRVPTKV